MRSKPNSLGCSSCLTPNGQSVLSLNGLRDSKSTELMEKMLALFGSGNTSFLFVQLFLRWLPPLVCTSLVSLPHSLTKDYQA